MKKNLKNKFLPYKTLTTASVKMYFRNKTAVFFTLFIPVMFILIFGAFNSTGTTKVKLALVNQSNTQLADGFVGALKKADKIFTVNQESEADGRAQLDQNKADVVVIVPKDFGAVSPTTRQPQPAKVTVLYNKGQPGAGQSASLIIGQIVTGFNTSITKAPQYFSVDAVGVSTHNLTYLDYLVPGIIALSIMQLGVTSIAFGFVSYKTSGALRRLHVTPTTPFAFLFGQSIARLIIAVLQVALLMGLSSLLFHIHFVGSILAMLVLAVIGTIVFLGFGFAVAGWAKDENQAAPVANLITFPMLFLSGTFFSREGLPEWLQKVTGILPLTYLADAMRSVSNTGASLWAVRGDILGLLIWGIIIYIIAIRVFKWE